MSAPHTMISRDQSRTVPPCSGRPALGRLLGRSLRGLWQRQGAGLVIACLALGVAAMAGVGSLAAAIEQSLTLQARTLLGGDLALHQPYLPPSEAVASLLQQAGASLSRHTELRAMVARPDAESLPALPAGDDLPLIPPPPGEASRPGDSTTARLPQRLLTEIKAVDPAYPLTGAVRLSPPLPVSELITASPEADPVHPDGERLWPAAAAPELFDRMGLQIGDRLRLGSITLILRARLEQEPDRLGAGLKLGPRLLLGQAALQASDLLQPGSLSRHSLQARFATPLTDPDADRLKTALTALEPQAGWTLRRPADGVPGVQRVMDQMLLFLSCVGMMTLLVGGVGVAGGVRRLLESRRTSLAIFKCLGAAPRSLLLLEGGQLAVLSAAGILLGLLAGALAPLLAHGLPLGLPVQPEQGIYPLPLLRAAGFGVLAAIGFAAAPLARALMLPATDLFRDSVAPARWQGTLSVRLVQLVCALGLGGLLLKTGHAPALAAILVGGVAVAALAAALLTVLIRRGAIRLARLGTARHWPLPLRLGLSFLHRPGAATAAIVLAAGLGMTLLVALAGVEAGLRRSLADSLPRQAPALFCADILPAQRDSFRALVAQTPGAVLRTAPMLRGRVVALRGEPVDPARIAPEAHWMVQGDRGLTAAATAPDNNRIVAGAWWPADYRGPPLVSLEEKAARGLGLTVGDSITVAVLGRPVTARIAALRAVDWTSLSMNFAIILSPNALAGAPAADLATISLPLPPEQRAAALARLDQQLAATLPGVTVVRVDDVLKDVEKMVGMAALALRGAAGVTLLAGLLVLAATVLAGGRDRARDVVLLKVLGASPRRLLLAMLAEFAVPAAAAALLSAGLGHGLAGLILQRLLHLPEAAPWGGALLTAAAGFVLVLLIGLGGRLPLLRRRPAEDLRAG